jgi:hypothetical protein
MKPLDPWYRAYFFQVESVGDDFPWLEIFVQDLCDSFGLENLFDDGNTVGKVALEGEERLIPVNREYLYVRALLAKLR